MLMESVHSEYSDFFCEISKILFTMASLLTASKGEQIASEKSVHYLGWAYKSLSSWRMDLPRATSLSLPSSLFYPSISLKSLNQREGKPAFACLGGNLKLDMIPRGLTPISLVYCILRSVRSLLPWLVEHASSSSSPPPSVPLLLLHFRSAKKTGLHYFLWRRILNFHRFPETRIISEYAVSTERLLLVLEVPSV